MTLLVIASGLIVLAALALAFVAYAARQFRQWDEPPVKGKREHWRP